MKKEEKTESSFKRLFLGYSPECDFYLLNIITNISGDSGKETKKLSMKKSAEYSDYKVELDEFIDKKLTPFMENVEKYPNVNHYTLTERSFLVPVKSGRENDEDMVKDRKTRSILLFLYYFCDRMNFMVKHKSRIRQATCTLAHGDITIDCPRICEFLDITYYIDSILHEIGHALMFKNPKLGTIEKCNSAEPRKKAVIGEEIKKRCSAVKKLTDSQFEEAFAQTFSFLAGRHVLGMSSAILERWSVEYASGYLGHTSNIETFKKRSSVKMTRYLSLLSSTFSEFLDGIER
jgi:hypothetical protein